MTRTLRLWRCIGALALAGLSAGCLGTPQTPLSFDGALQHLETDLLPQIALEEVDPLQAAGLRPVSAPTSLADQLPAAEAYPLQGGNPQLPAGDGRLQVEIVSSAEKADGCRPERRWLVEVAERFNQRQERSASGRRIEVLIRTIPSGLAAQMLLAGRLRPAGYTPASAQWLDLLQRQGLAPTRIAERLVGNGSVIAMHRQAWRRLGGQGAPDFAGVVDHALAGRLRMGFCHPFIFSPGPAGGGSAAPGGDRQLRPVPAAAGQHLAHLPGAGGALAQRSLCLRCGADGAAELAAAAAPAWL